MKAAGVLFTTMIVAGAAWASGPDVQEIVRRSVANNEVNWKAAPQFTFSERDVETKGGHKTDRTYQVLMIDGSQYNKLIAVNGEPLSRAAAASEEQKLQREIARRRNEPPAERNRRVAKYQAERRQDHALMREMTQAFTFKLTGEETVNGRQCYVLEATPRPGYVPKSRETKVLTGMRGKMWVDTQQYQWVKVHAQVFRPVAFGLFIAHVQPGTEFTLEEGPVGGNIWQPIHFSTRVNASVLVWSRRSTDDERYSDYRRTAPEPQKTARR